MPTGRDRMRGYACLQQGDTSSSTIKTTSLSFFKGTVLGMLRALVVLSSLTPRNSSVVD